MYYVSTNLSLLILFCLQRFRLPKFINLFKELFKHPFLDFIRKSYPVNFFLFHNINISNLVYKIFVKEREEVNNAGNENK